MKNWTGNISWNPAKYILPNNENDIAAIVHEAIDKKTNIRVIGSGHSFSPLCVTTGYTLCLDKMQHIQQEEADKKLVRVQGGAKLFRISEALNKLELAQENMGDIDRQSVAGATATGTHGTGISFGNISTQIEELTFINGEGKTVTTNASEPAVFNSARISLGSLGIITEVKLRVVPAYILKQEKKRERFSEIVKNLDFITENNRQFEFHWLLHTDTVQSKYINITNEQPKNTSGFAQWLDEIVFENYLFLMMNIISRIFPSLCAFLNKIAARFVGNSVKIDLSNKVFSTKRTVRFYETEYNIPYEHYPTVVEEMLKKFEQKKIQNIFPAGASFCKR